MLASAIALVGLFTVVNQSAASAGWMATLIATVFDPAWNVAHRGVIWAVIVLVLFFSGVGLPLPEDIPLSLAGFTTFKQAGEQVVLTHFVLTFLTVVIPILLGDMLAYSLGRRYGFGLRDRFRLIKRALSDKRLERVQRWFDNYGSFTVFLGRQVAGVRFVTFFTAGTMRVPFGRFVFFDFLGCLVSVPVWLTLGVLASRYGEAWLQVAVRRVGSGFFIGAIVVFALFFIATKLRASTKSSAASAPTARIEAAPRPINITEKAE